MAELLFVIVQTNPLLIQGYIVHLYLNSKKLQAVIEEDWKAVALLLIGLKCKSSRSCEPRIHLHKVHFFMSMSTVKPYPKIPRNSPSLQTKSENLMQYSAISSNPFLYVWIFKVVLSYFITTVACEEGSELLMTDQFRLQWANDGACLCSHCANSKSLQSLIWHDLVLPSILQHRMLPIIVFLIGYEESTPPATTILSLNANLVRVEVGGKFEEVLITFDVRADVRNEGDASLAQQLDDLDLITQAIEQFCRGTPYSESVLLTELLSFIIDQHEYNIRIAVLGLHVCNSLKIFEQTIRTEGANDALFMVVLERGRDIDEGMCSQEGVSACDHLEVGVVVVNVEQSGAVYWTNVKETLMCVFEEGQQLFYQGY